MLGFSFFLIFDDLKALSRVFRAKNNFYIFFKNNFYQQLFRWNDFFVQSNLNRRFSLLDDFMKIQQILRKSICLEKETMSGY